MVSGTSLASHLGRRRAGSPGASTIAADPIKDQLTILITNQLILNN